MPGVGRDARLLLEPGQVATVEALTSLLNDLAGISAEVVLVLDDYHVIEAREIHEAIAFLLDRLPPRVHLVTLVGIHRWTFALGPAFVADAPLRPRAPPPRADGCHRRPILAASGIAVVLGFIHVGAPEQGLAPILDAVWEIGVMGVYPIFVGVRAPAVARLLGAPATDQQLPAVRGQLRPTMYAESPLFGWSKTPQSDERGLSSVNNILVNHS